MPRFILFDGAPTVAECLASEKNPRCPPLRWQTFKFSIPAAPPARSTAAPPPPSPPEASQFQDAETLPKDRLVEDEDLPAWADGTSSQFADADTSGEGKRPKDKKELVPESENEEEVEKGQVEECLGRRAGISLPEEEPEVEASTSRFTLMGPLRAQSPRRRSSRFPAASQPMQQRPHDISCPFPPIAPNITIQSTTFHEDDSYASNVSRGQWIRVPPQREISSIVKVEERPEEKEELIPESDNEEEVETSQVGERPGRRTGISLPEEEPDEEASTSRFSASGLLSLGVSATDPSAAALMGPPLAQSQRRRSSRFPAASQPMQPRPHDISCPYPPTAPDITIQSTTFNEDDSYASNVSRGQWIPAPSQLACEISSIVKLEDGPEEREELISESENEEEAAKTQMEKRPAKRVRISLPEEEPEDEASTSRFSASCLLSLSVSAADASATAFMLPPPTQLQPHRSSRFPAASQPIHQPPHDVSYPFPPTALDNTNQSTTFIRDDSYASTFGGGMSIGAPPRFPWKISSIVKLDKLRNRLRPPSNNRDRDPEVSVLGAVSDVSRKDTSAGPVTEITIEDETGGLAKAVIWGDAGDELGTAIRRGDVVYFGHVKLKHRDNQAIELRFGPRSSEVGICWRTRRFTAEDDCYHFHEGFREVLPEADAVLKVVEWFLRYREG
ncbi:hypothetical protein JCM1841_000723 [Sporobolomyces salmonicolor]